MIIFVAVLISSFLSVKLSFCLKCPVFYYFHIMMCDVAWFPTFGPFSPSLAVPAVNTSAINCVGFLPVSHAFSQSTHPYITGSSCCSGSDPTLKQEPIQFPKAVPRTKIIPSSKAGPPALVTGTMKRFIQCESPFYGRITA